MNHYSQLDSVLLEIMNRWDIPGLGVGIVENGEIAYVRGYGVQNLATKVPVTPDSIFCVSSISKCFVASAIMQLVEHGKLHLDIPLIEYLPDFRLDDDRFQQVTICQMLSHTSGLPDMDEAEYDELVAKPEYDEGALERYIRTLTSRKMIAAPGERFTYSNIAYNILGYLIARISGETFEEYMQEHILRPAGMPESTFFFPDAPRQRLAVPHLRSPAMTVNPAYPYHRADAPASFLHSTMIEMCHWAITCLNGGRFNGQPILSPAGYELMWTPIAEWGHPPLYEHTGLGWTLGHFEGLKTVSHGGMGLGWTDFLTLLPEKNCGAVILCNEESSARGRTVRAVLHCMLDKEPIVNTISWMVPIGRALEEGGLAAAYARYDEIKDRAEYFLSEDELLILARQLCNVKKYDMAIDVLELNLHVFPKHIDSFISLAKLYILKGDRARATSAIDQALAIEPSDIIAESLLLQVSA
jgi:CubicO group peptidase (beta-lactamase class C family)